MHVQIYLVQAVSKLEKAQPSAAPIAQPIQNSSTQARHDMAQVMDTVVEQLAKVWRHQIEHLSLV